MVRHSHKQRSGRRSVRRSQKTQSKGGRKSLRKGGAGGLNTSPEQVGGGILLFVDDARYGLLLADENQKQIYEIAKQEFEPKERLASVGPAWWFDDKKYYISEKEIEFKYGDRVMKYTWGIKSGKYFMLNKDSKKIRFFQIYEFDPVDYDQIKRKGLITYEKEWADRHDF